jgi:hypothetical protein
MAQAQICPVCGGKGQIEKHPGQTTTDASFGVTCHGCNGKGWVEVGGYEPYPQYPSMPYEPWQITYGTGLSGETFIC